MNLSCGGLGRESTVINCRELNTHAVDYYDNSRFPGESVAEINDRHLHPLESRSLRITLDS